MAKSAKSTNSGSSSRTSSASASAAQQHLVHALDFLQKPSSYSLGPLVLVAGSDAYLRRLVIDEIISEYQKISQAPFQSMIGEQLEWRDLARDLATGSLFEPEYPRLIIIDDADTFVSANRARLEKYATAPGTTARLVIVVHALAANTKLYQIAASQHLIIQCKAPELSGGRAVDERRVAAWLRFRSQSKHQIQLEQDAAEAMIALIGPEFGLLDQELAKLAVQIWPERRITADLVRQHVGNWRLRTGWDLIDAITSGDVPAALDLLQRLLECGDGDVNMIFGQISWALRQYAAATRNVQRAERAGRKITVQQALSAAGVRDYPPGNLQRAVAQLRRIGRQRGSQLYRWLLETDLALKGSHARPGRARFALEQLILRLR